MSYLIVKLFLSPHRQIYNQYELKGTLFYIFNF